jgi:hypothetical protein
MKTPQQKLIIALVFIWLVTIATACFIIRANNKKIHSLDQANGMLANDITVYKHVNGKLISTNQAAELRAKEFKNALPELADALTKQMDIKLKNLRAGVVAAIEARGSGNASISRIPYAENSITSDPEWTYTTHDGKTYKINAITGDSTFLDLTITSDSTFLGSKFEPFALTFDDGYLNFKSDVYNELDAPSEYTYGDTVKFSFNMKGKFLQRKQLYVSGALANPNAKILNSQGVLVNEFKQKRFGVGPSVSWGIGPDLKPQTTIGFSLHWSWIKF